MNRLIWKTICVVDALKVQNFAIDLVESFVDQIFREQGWTSAFMERSVKRSEFF